MTFHSVATVPIGSTRDICSLRPGEGDGQRPLWERLDSIPVAKSGGSPSLRWVAKSEPASPAPVIPYPPRGVWRQLRRGRQGAPPTQNRYAAARLQIPCNNGGARARPGQKCWARSPGALTQGTAWVGRTWRAPARQGCSPRSEASACNHDQSAKG